ncbi:MAG: glycoside hydrolase family 30 protein [Holophagaceae bacterium]|uniref:Glycoside hydrolase family 30 protein n=1 Tax=Candidatus Geothrix skivensis TaxID=2954439 RepID=A0A9D7SIF5_9BACT|nr:glycoside hydrolase family 30 protein [Candidatus Geothrix skivensis]
MPPPSPRPIRMFLTARDENHRLAEVPALWPATVGPERHRIQVEPGLTFQTIEGFGGAFTEAAAVTWFSLSPARREEVLQAYFHPVAGHGYTLCRVPMGSCDFALGNYAHVETEGDVELATFTIARDRQALIPFIRAAQKVAGGPIKLLASPWSPPAWMKSNGQMNQGGTLLPQYRQAWARCFVRFVQAYAEEGIPIWGLTVQNEPMATQPWDSCLYSAEAERDFVRDFLGPELASAGLGEVKIIIWDHNRDLMVERARVAFTDPVASDFIWGTGFHWYGEDCFEHVQQVHDAWPHKHLLFTEGCQEDGPHRGSWELGERYARSMIQDLNRWTEGWIDWNLLLDTRGGPNHVGNLCSAPVLADTTEDALLWQSSYYYLGHFARFVKVGALRLGCESTDANLEATAFRNPDGTIATVVMNRTEATLGFELNIIDGAGFRTGLPPRSIATYLFSGKASV